MNDWCVSCVPTPIRVEQMRLVRNLIDVKISEDELRKANFREGLSIRVKSARSFVVNAYWIVKIKELHQEIERDWTSMREAMASNEFLTDGHKSLYQSRPMAYDEETSRAVDCPIRPPRAVDTSDMQTQQPRDFYPLVIIVTCRNRQDRIEADDLDAVAANIHLVHIRDSVVPVRTHVIKQYIKQVDGRVLDISRLYQEESGACIICFERKASDPAARGKLFCLLPCRHSPVCSDCILRIRECPKCRCPIASVFDIDAPNVNPPQHTIPGANRPTIDPNLLHLYEDTPAGRGNNTAGEQNEQRSGCFSWLMRTIFGL